jgi:hypothetical protein
VTIKNCNIRGTLNGLNAAPIGIQIGSVAANFRRAENIKVIGCNIQNVLTGISAKGMGPNPIGLQDLGLVISGNIIGGEPNTYIGGAGQNLAGIYIGNQANVLIENNEISNCSPNSMAFSGILLAI